MVICGQGHIVLFFQIFFKLYTFLDILDACGQIYIQVEILRLLTCLFFGCAGSLLRWLFSGCRERELLSRWVLGLLTAVVSLVVEHRLRQVQCVGSVLVVPGLKSTSSLVMVHWLICSAACGIFPDQGSNLCSALAGGFFTTEPPGKP